jgi:FAD/FMN-containing dehydrogenase
MSETPKLLPPAANTIETLVRIVGDQHALRDEAGMAPYLTEWRDRYRGQAALVLRPGSTDEVAAILKCANAARVGIVPQGGNTGLVGAQIPDESGSQVVLSLTRLNHVRDVDLASNTMTVEAGLTLSMAQQVAESAHRLFPLSLASEGSCQIGGVLATNAGGLAVLAYGNARDLALGLEVVLADGRVWHGLKALRKDNTGYDLKDLFIGSEGTLGVITAAVLRLFPRPMERVTCMAGLNDLARAPEFFTRVHEAAGPMLTAFEILPRIGIEFAVKHGNDTREPFPAPHAWYLLFDLTSPRVGEEPHLLAETLLQEAIEGGEIADAIVATSIKQAPSTARTSTSRPSKYPDPHTIPGADEALRDDPLRRWAPSYRLRLAPKAFQAHRASRYARTLRRESPSTLREQSRHRPRARFVLTQ